ncbi:phosphoglycerate kinase, partial [bacterium]|nr:phosphoglycerate kinase [bacterium]
MHKLSISDLEIEDKKVLIRCDFNVPLDERGRITDDTRITAALPTIRYVLGRDCPVILMSHLGRPEGKVDPKLSLKPVAERLGELLNLKVIMAPDCIGHSVEKMARKLKGGEVLLLENLRFHSGEEANDGKFAQQLASLADVFVQDADGHDNRLDVASLGSPGNRVGDGSLDVVHSLEVINPSGHGRVVVYLDGDNSSFAGAYDAQGVAE